MGAITLYVLAMKASRTLAIMIDFLVVKTPSSYNVILGCPTLNNLRAVTSTYHLKMKFPTRLEVRKVHNEQVLARKLRREVKEV